MKTSEHSPSIKVLTFKVPTFRLLLAVWIIFAGLVIAVPGYSQNNLDANVEEARGKVRKDPRNPFNYETLGWAYLQRFMEEGNQADANRAIKVFRKYTKLDPKEPHSWYGLGVAYYQSGRIEESGENFGKALSLDRDYFQARIAMGNYFLNKGMFREASGHYQKAAKLESNNQFVYANLAQLYLGMGKYRKSLSFVDKALDIDDSNVHSNLIKAKVYRLQGNNEEALSILKKLRKENPRHSAAVLELAMTFYDMGDNKRAKTFAMKHNTLNPSSGRGFELLANIYKRTGRKAKAKGNIKLAENLYYNKLVGGAKDFYGSLSWIYSEFGINPNKSIDYAQKYLKFKQTDDALQIHAWALYKNEEYDKALKSLRKAIDLNSRLSGHWYRLGLIYKALNNIALSKKAFKKSLTMGPNTWHEEAKAELFALQ